MSRQVLLPSFSCRIEEYINHSNCPAFTASRSVYTWRYVWSVREDDATLRAGHTWAIKRSSPYALVWAMIRCERPFVNLTYPYVSREGCSHVITCMCMGSEVISTDPQYPDRSVYWIDRNSIVAHHFTARSNFSSSVNSNLMLEYLTTVLRTLFEYVLGVQRYVKFHAKLYGVPSLCLFLCSVRHLYPSARLGSCIYVWRMIILCPTPNSMGRCRLALYYGLVYRICSPTVGGAIQQCVKIRINTHTNWAKTINRVSGYNEQTYEREANDHPGRCLMIIRQPFICQVRCHDSSHLGE